MTRIYADFLTTKHAAAVPTGFTVADGDLNPRLMAFQRRIVPWATRLGRAAIFSECGTGKTLMQLEWGRLVHRHTRKPILLLCPLAVAWQTKAEAEKFQIGSEVKVCREQADVIDGINITNYERLHLFDAEEFGGIVLDESSVLKNYTGKTKQQLCNLFTQTPFRLCCTATPAPNDRMELGNHAEFLGVMPSSEMLSRWFINDTMKAGGYRLRSYAKNDFWRWVASWSVCVTKPSDIGCDDEGYDVPELIVHEHITRDETTAEGFLFNTGNAVSATTVHREKRISLAAKVKVVEGLVLGDKNKAPWTIWCGTDYEADALIKALRGASGGMVEVRGSQKPEQKEAGLRSFSECKSRIIVTKASLGGFGLNWQHCHQTVWFASFSYEEWYQAIRRLWRFGQKNAVHCHCLMSEAEQSIKKAIERKQKEHAEMQEEMRSLMHEAMQSLWGGNNRPTKYTNTLRVGTPSWLHSKTLKTK